METIGERMSCEIILSVKDTHDQELLITYIAMLICGHFRLTFRCLCTSVIFI